MTVYTTYKTSKPFEFRVREAKSNNDLILRIHMEHQMLSPEIYINQKTLLFRQRQLVECLRAFVNEPASIDAFRALATEGYHAFNEIDTELRRVPTFYKLWKSRFLGDMPSKIRVTKQTDAARQLDIRLPRYFTFPFGLLFIKDPRSLVWDEDCIKRYIPYFFDVMFDVQYYFSMDEYQWSFWHDNALKNNGKQKIEIIHAINDSFDVELEKKAWALDADIEPFFCLTTDDLIKRWSQLPSPSIFHFSTHYEFDDQVTPSYSLRFSGNDIFNSDHLRGITRPHESKPGFFFLNTCSSGVITQPGYSNILMDLYPEYSLGFIATLYDIFDKSAGFMPAKFYEMFIHHNKPVSLAFFEAKRYLLFSQNEYSALGYLLWQVNPMLYYKQPDIKHLGISKKEIILS